MAIIAVRKVYREPLLFFPGALKAQTGKLARTVK
jgi:hypothetical protein